MQNCHLDFLDPDWNKVGVRLVRADAVGVGESGSGALGDTGTDIGTRGIRAARLVRRDFAVKFLVINVRRDEERPGLRLRDELISGHVRTQRRVVRERVGVLERVLGLLVSAGRGKEVRRVKRNLEKKRQQRENPWNPSRKCGIV